MDNGHSNLETFRKVREKKNSAQVGIEYIYGQIYMYIQGNPYTMQNSNTLYPDRPLHDRSAAGVIAQQYSSLPSDRAFISAREKTETLFKN